MTTPLPQLLQGVQTLNRPDQPFAFTVDGDRIVGSWIIQHAAFASVGGAEAIDDRYTVTVVPKGEGEFELDEVRSTSEGGVEARDGTIGFGGSTKVFKGKQIGMSKGFSIGPNVSQDGPGMTYSYSFETRLIKEPLLAYLAANGWQERKGFFGRLFG